MRAVRTLLKRSKVLRRVGCSTNDQTVIKRPSILHSVVIKHDELVYKIAVSESIMDLVMRICLFTDTLGDLNGVSRFIQDMGEQAQHQQIDLQVITSTGKPLPQHAYVHNLSCLFKMPMPFYQEMDLVWPSSKVIRSILNELKPDIVHISTPGPFGWRAKSIAEKMGYPLVGTYHTDFPAYLHDLTGSQWVKREIDRVMHRFYRPFEHVFSRSQVYLEVMASDIGIDYQRASVLFPGTNLSKFHPKHKNEQAWSQYGLSKERLKVLYVGRINVEKNIPFLIEIWKAFRESHPEIEADLVMVGEGRYRKWADKVRPYHAYFLGPLEGERLSEVYASADLFVFPSTTDTLGQVVMEAQASGLGCLVSNVGGPQSLIVDNETGQILPEEKPSEWVEALFQVLSNPQTRQDFKNNSRQHIERYNIVDSFNQFIEVHKKIYHSLCQKN